MTEITPEQQATIDEFEKEIADMANDGLKVVSATDQLLAMYVNSTKGFEDRRDVLKREIEERQRELADVVIALKSIEAASQAIDAGRSLEKTSVKPNTTGTVK